MNSGKLLKDQVFIAAIVTLAVVWAVASHGLGLVDTISSPEIVVEEMIAIAASGELVYNVAQSLWHIAIGFVVAMIVGTTLGVLMGMRPFWGKVFRPYIAVGLALPPLFAVVFPAMWFGPGLETVVAAGAISAFPFFARNVYAGINDIDTDLVVMSKSFGVSRGRTVRRIVLQSVMPEWIAGARYSLALCWKVVIFAEFLLGDTGVGARIGNQMEILSISGVLAWTLLFVIAYMVIEYGILQQIESRVFVWRDDTSLSTTAG